MFLVLLVVTITMVSSHKEKPLVPMLKNTTVSISNKPVPISKHINFGNAATPGQIPWQAAIRITKPNGSYFCSGSLIHVSWVLSAGHCTYNATKLEILLGTIKSSAAENKIISRTVFTHADYTPSNMNNDIGLIKLPTPANISDLIKVIPIVPITTTTFHNTYVSGWGKIHDAAGVTQNLQYIPVHVIRNKRCAATFSVRVITANTICTQGYNKRSPCAGDSGGPMAIWGNNPQLVGIVSFIASSGCEKGHPAGYVRAANYRSWINNITGLSL